MRVNEENFTTGNKEDVEPDYVEAILGNHNGDESAHPKILKLIDDAKIFYQDAKDRVEGVAEAAAEAQDGAVTAAINAATSEESAALDAIAANESRQAAQAAQEVAENSAAEALQYLQDAEIAQMKSPYVGENGNWFVVNRDDVNSYVDTGVKAQGESVSIDDAMSSASENPVRNKVIKAYVDARVVGELVPLIESKADTENVYTKTEVDEAIQSAILDSWEVAV